MSGRYGAAIAAIRQMPHLMSLRQVRAEAPPTNSHKEHEQAVATTAQDAIKLATYALDKKITERDHGDADHGGAARCLLAIEQGTETMLLHERRKRAAGRAIKLVPSMGHRHPGKKTYEERLMDNVASKLLAREVKFLRREQEYVDGDTIARIHDSPWLRILHQVWLATIGLCSDLRMYRDPTWLPSKNPGRYYWESTLGSFGKFWELLEEPYLLSPPVPSDYQLQPTLSAMDLLALMCNDSPFEPEALHSLPKPPGLSLGRWSGPPDEAVTIWRKWLEECQCDNSNPSPLCSVHRFLFALEQYKAQLERCWETLRDPYGTIKRYRRYQSVAHILMSHGIFVDT
jgi:hypothetical protein